MRVWQAILRILKGARSQAVQQKLRVALTPQVCYEIRTKNIIDTLAKSRKSPFSVIPVQTGIQAFQALNEGLDPVFQRGDDFLRFHQHSFQEIPFPDGKRPRSFSGPFVKSKGEFVEVRHRIQISGNWPCK
jgi:hypothetical protein